MKKVLVIGSTGMLGRTMEKYFKSQGYIVCVLNRKDLNLSSCSWDELEDKIIESDCDVAINCAGLIVQRKDTPVEDFLMVNSIIPRWLANICEQQNIELYHPTTDCIYDGSKGPYEEDEPYTENGIYGVSKSLGEPSNCAVIRSSIIGEEENNKLSFLEWVRNNAGNTVNGYTNHLWNGVTCLEMCKIIDEIIKSDTYFKGTKHYYSPTVSKADMVNYVNEIYDLGITVNSMSAGDGVVDKSLRSRYTESRKDLKEQIKEQMDFWNE